MFDNKSNSGKTGSVMSLNNFDENESGAAFLVRILRYLETPQYLRKALFPKHGSLRFVVGTEFVISCGLHILSAFFVVNFLMW